MLYFSLFYPHITYDIVAWGSTYSSYLHHIQILQNKTIRAITDVGFKQEFTPIYNQSEILKLKNVHTLALGKFMHQYSKASLPSSLSSLFSLVNNFHSYSTRNCNNFSLSCYSSSRLQSFFIYHGIKTWNCISTKTRQENYNQFKIKFQKALLAQQI